MIMLHKYDRFDEAVFMAASSLAEEMVKTSSAKIIGSDKYEFIHRAKSRISSDLKKVNPYNHQVFTIGVYKGTPDNSLKDILSFKPELINYFPKNVRVVIDPSDDYTTTLVKGDDNNASFRNYQLS